MMAMNLPRLSATDWREATSDDPEAAFIGNLHAKVYPDGGLRLVLTHREAGNREPPVREARAALAFANESLRLSGAPCFTREMEQHVRERGLSSVADLIDSITAT